MLLRRKINLKDQLISDMVTEDKTLAAYLDATIWKQGGELPIVADLKKMETDFITTLVEYKDGDYDSYRFLYSYYGKQLVSRSAFLVKLKDSGTADAVALTLLSSATRLRETMKSLDPVLYKRELGGVVSWARRQHRKRERAAADAPRSVDVEPASLDVSKPQEDGEMDNIIRGVKGLADFLKISVSKAQAIVNSRILMNTNPIIQYNAGGWRFYRDRLENYIANNPVALDKAKCPH